MKTMLQTLREFSKGKMTVTKVSDGYKFFSYGEEIWIKDNVVNELGARWCVSYAWEKMNSDE